MNNEQLIPITDPGQLRESGLPFKTTHSARWCYRKAAERGLAKAFVRIGRRIFVDPKKFHELARERSASLR